MAMRFENVIIDARDPKALATWWAEALAWVVHAEDPEIGEYDVCERLNEDGTYSFPELVFGAVPDPGLGRERVHLDLNSFSLDDQRATVERLLSMGATHADVGQASDAKFVVLADPEGNHFCVLDPRREYAHLGSLAGYTLAAHDAGAIWELWAVATGWKASVDEHGDVALAPPDGGIPLEIITRPTMPVDHAKNRIHLDVRPSAHEDQAEVVARLVALGARPVDVGQHDGPPVSWVVLADPEGNELCVLAPGD